MAIKFKPLTTALQAIKDQFVKPNDEPSLAPLPVGEPVHPEGVVESTLSDNGKLLAAAQPATTVKIATTEQLAPVFKAIDEAEAKGQDPYLAGITSSAGLLVPTGQMAQQEIQALKDKPVLAGNPDKPETCVEHVLNPQTKACVRCLMPMADHPMASTPQEMPKLSRFKITIKPGAPSGKPEPPPEPKTPLSSLMAALEAKPEAPPWEAPDGYTILDALKEHWSRSSKGEVLQLLNVKNGGTSWTVKSYSPETGRAVLEGQDKMIIRPVISEREVPLYTPFWR